MSLKPSRQLAGLNTDYPTFNTSERGGILSFGTVSGINIVEYARDPAGAVPVGIQYNDVEHLDLSRQIHPQHLGRRVDVSFAIVGAATDGEFITDWIDISGTLMPGQPAYVGASGTITNNLSLGGSRIGTFMSPLTVSPHTVTFAGAGWSRLQMDPVRPHAITHENNPADRILVITPGFAKVRVKHSYMSGKAG